MAKLLKDMPFKWSYSDLIDQPSPLQEAMDAIVKDAIAASMRGETVILKCDGEIVSVIPPHRFFKD